MNDELLMMNAELTNSALITQHSVLKVPEIRFKGFSRKWVEKELGTDVADIIGGGTPSTSISEFWNGDIDWYSPTEIGSNVYAEGSQKKITALGLKSSSAKILPAGNTILFTSRAGIGDMAILARPGATNQGFQSFVVKEGVSPYFIYSAGKQIKEFALKHASGSTFLEISGKQLGRMKILVPCEKEQTQIGNYFQRLDSLINQHQQQHAKLSNIKKAMLEKMFPKQGETIPEIRFKGFSGEWESLALGENAIFKKGQGYSKSDLSESGIPIILYGRLYTKYQTVISQIDTFVKEKSKSLKSIGKEVIVPASGESSEDIARGSAVCESGVILGGDLNVIYPNDKINPVFLALMISNGCSHKELVSKAQGKSVVHIRNSDLESLLLAVPDKKEQTAIGNYFQKLDALINQHQQQISKLNNIKQSFLSKMFV